MRTAPPAADDDEKFLGFQPFPSRGGIVTNEIVEQIREEISE
ncbi:MAG: hypothetical protein QM621_06860 [Aeromicrobium sp.]